MSTKLIPIDTSFPEPEFTITMDQALAVADQNRWEILQAEYAYRAAKEQVKVAKSGYLPSVQVGGGYNWEDDDFPGFDHEGWSITGGLSWSLWDGGATDAKIKSANAAMHSAEETLQQVRESVALEVKQDYLNILSAKEKSVLQRLRSMKQRKLTKLQQYGISPVWESIWMYWMHSII